MAINDVYQAVLDYEEETIGDLVNKELSKGTDINELLQKGLIAAMDTVGKNFSAGELFVPEMLLAAQTMKAGLEVLKPKLGGAGASKAGTIIVGTVKGDLHDIGKNLVAMMLEGGGFEVYDIGVDAEPSAFIEAAKAHKADIIGMSALLTTTMPSMETTVAEIKKAGLKVKTMIGGAPVTQAFAEKIGADGYSEDAPAAVNLARSFMK